MRAGARHGGFFRAEVALKESRRECWKDGLWRSTASVTLSLLVHCGCFLVLFVPDNF